MFMGEYNHSIDAKGRMIVPAKFREQLGNEFVAVSYTHLDVYKRQGIAHQYVYHRSTGILIGTGAE